MPQPLDLDPIEQRANAATDGPWWNDEHEIYQGEPGNHDRWVGETCDPDAGGGGSNNGEFIAHARTDVPNLLAEIRRLRAELKQREDLLVNAHCRLHLVQSRVEQIGPADEPAGIALDLIPWLDGPLHPSHLAEYHAARTVQDRRCGCSARFTRHADGCPTLTAQES